MNTIELLHRERSLLTPAEKHLADRALCQARVSELHFLHERLADLLGHIVQRIRPGVLREVLAAQHDGDRAITAELLDHATRYGLEPLPGGNITATALLQEVRYADRCKSEPDARARAIQRALRAVRLHAIEQWGSLMDALVQEDQTGFKQQAQHFQTREASLYRQLRALSSAIDQA